MTLSITAVLDGWSPPRVRLDVDSTTGAPLPVPAGSPVAVVRVHADGTRWPVLLEDGARLGAGSWAGFDYHAPFNQAVTYVAQAAGNESAASAEVRILNAKTTWLCHDSTPALSFRPDIITKIGDLGYKSDAETFDVYNSAYPVTVSSGFRRAAASSLEFLITADRVPAVRALLASSGAVLINTPSKPGWDVGWAWVQPGDVTISNDGASGFDRGSINYPYRKVVFPFQVIGAPDVDVTPTWTCDDVVATYATCDVMLSHYTTCENLALDVRS
jgi:hypothetical protein